MTFQARRQSCPVPNCLMKLLPQQHNYKQPFARSRKESSRPRPSSLNSGAYSSTAPFQCKEPRKRAERPQPGTGGWTTGAMRTGVGLALVIIHVCTCRYAPRLSRGRQTWSYQRNASSYTQVKNRLEGLFSYASTWGISTTFLSCSHHGCGADLAAGFKRAMLPASNRDESQPCGCIATLKMFWLIFLRRCANLSFYLFTSAETPTRNKRPALKVGKYDPWPSGCSRFPPLQ